jgi:hypothetical protein
LNQAVLLGGLFIGVLSALPIVNIANCCCLWIIGGGALAAYFAQQNDPAPLGLLTGARIGFRAGLVGAVIWLLASLAIDVIVAPLQQRVVGTMLRNATDMPPEVRAWLETVGDRATAPLRYGVGFLFQLLIAAPFAAFGGVVGAAVFARAEPAHRHP